MLLLVAQDLCEQVAADIILHIFAMGDGAAQLRQRLILYREIGLKDFLHSLADPQASEHLEVGKPAEEEDPFRQAVGMLHLVDRLGALEGGEPADAPIVEHPVMKPILVGRGELVLQRFVEQLDDLGIALHPLSPESLPRAFGPAAGWVKGGGAWTGISASGRASPQA